MSRILVTVALAACAAQTALASVARATNDVFVPPILDPHAGTVWNKDETRTVTWDVSNAPQNITNSKGIIILAKGGIATPLVLANDFDILLGKIDVKVPWVIPDDDYSVKLIGDSGNLSPEFTINGPKIF
ncbi:hypothetical protein C8Q74DRAFT_1363411 [Fomes fomentarius]|nr:hypothetical protein C8Q74DRAFT_1363411 [Fomes fomentarius]